MYMFMPDQMIEHGFARTSVIPGCGTGRWAEADKTGQIPHLPPCLHAEEQE